MWQNPIFAVSFCKTPENQFNIVLLKCIGIKYIKLVKFEYAVIKFFLWYWEKNRNYLGHLPVTQEFHNECLCSPAQNTAVSFSHAQVLQVDTRTPRIIQPYQNPHRTHKIVVVQPSLFQSSHLQYPQHNPVTTECNTFIVRDTWEQTWKITCLVFLAFLVNFCESTAQLWQLSLWCMDVKNTLFIVPNQFGTWVEKVQYWCACEKYYNQSDAIKNQHLLGSKFKFLFKFPQNIKLFMYSMIYIYYIKTYYHSLIADSHKDYKVCHIYSMSECNLVSQPYWVFLHSPSHNLFIICQVKEHHMTWITVRLPVCAVLLCG